MYMYMYISKFHNIHMNFVLCSGILDDMEYGCYGQLFDHITQSNPPQLDLIGMLY